MTDIDFNELKGLRLLGVLGTEQSGNYEYSMIVYLYVGYADEYECFKAISFDFDGYGHFDDWKLERVDPFVRDSRYKAIGEEILEVEDFKEQGRGDGDRWGIRLKTASKVLEFSNDNMDCCYVDALWDIL
jgi:hypothetical protein